MSNDLPSTPSVSDLSSVEDMETPAEMRRTFAILDDDPLVDKKLKNAAPKRPRLSSAMEAAIAAAAEVNNPSALGPFSPIPEESPVTPPAYAFPDDNTATPASYPFPDPGTDPETPTAAAPRRASNNPQGRPRRYRVGPRGGRPRKRFYGGQTLATGDNRPVKGIPAGWDQVLDKSIPLATRLSMASKMMKPGLTYESKYGNIWKERKMDTTAADNKQRMVFALLKQEFLEFCDRKKRTREAEAMTSEPTIAQQRAEMFREDEWRYEPSDRHTQKDFWVTARLAESSVYYAAPVKMEVVSEEEFVPEETEEQRAEGEQTEEEESNEDDEDSSQSDQEGEDDDEDSSQSDQGGEDDDAESIEAEERRVDAPGVIMISSSSDSGYEESSDEDMED